MSIRGERVIVVGHGKAGGSLAASMRRAHIDVSVVSGRELPKKKLDATLVLLCVPDRFIREMHVDVEEGCVVAHVAGAAVLTDVDAVRRGAFHPLASLDGVSPVPRGSLCAWDADDGDDDAGVRLRRLAKRLGLVAARVRDEDRAAYHAGAVIAGNLASALLQLGVEQLRKAGVDDDVARVSLSRLLASTAARSLAAPLSLALTGPVARKDAATLKKHAAVIVDVDAGAAYRLLSRVLIERVLVATDDEKRALIDALR